MRDVSTTDRSSSPHVVRPLAALPLAQPGQAVSSGDANQLLSSSASAHIAGSYRPRAGLPGNGGDGPVGATGRTDLGPIDPMRHTACAQELPCPPETAGDRIQHGCSDAPQSDLNPAGRQPSRSPQGPIRPCAQRSPPLKRQVCLRGWPSAHRGAYSSDPATTGLASTPIPSISTSHRSPGFRNTGGLRANPTPGGVPV